MKKAIQIGFEILVSVMVGLAAAYVFVEAAFGVGSVVK